MNNEIKEILDFKEDADYKRLSVDEIAILRGYITNLQEENKQLKKKINIEWLSDEGKYQYAIDSIVLEMDKLEEENERLNNVITKIKELVDNYEELEKTLGVGKPRFDLYKLQEILKEKQNETTI